MLMVVPVEELGAPRPPLLHIAERPGWVLECLELGLGEGVVVAHPGTGVGAPPSAPPRGRESPCGHGARRYLVDSEAAWLDAMAMDGFSEQLLGECTVLARRQHPGHHEAAVEVEHHVEIQEYPSGQAAARSGETGSRGGLKGRSRVVPCTRLPALALHPGPKLAVGIGEIPKLAQRQKIGQRQKGAEAGSEPLLLRNGGCD
jgi:hypothetical protein